MTRARLPNEFDVGELLASGYMPPPRPWRQWLDECALALPVSVSEVRFIRSLVRRQPEQLSAAQSEWLHDIHRRLMRAGGRP